MLPRSLRYTLAGCLIHATFVSARVGIKIPIIINASSVFTAAFSFLVIFSILTGFLFLAAFGKACGLKDELPPGVSPMKYDVGRLYNILVFVGVSLWWSQLIIYTVYVRDVFISKPRKPFPDSAYVARPTPDQLTDFFLAASVLYLIHYRRQIHRLNATVTPLSMVKKIFDALSVIVHLGVIGYTTAFLAISVADEDNENKNLNWLTSYYVYTAVYALMVLNVTITLTQSNKTLQRNFIKDETYNHASAALGALIVHAIFKIIMAALYSQYNNPKIDYDVLRVFEVIVLPFTYLIAQFSLMLAGEKSTEDDKIMKEIKKMEKSKAEVHDHSK